MFTRTAFSGVTSTVTPLFGAVAPKASWMRFTQPPFMPKTPGTSRTAKATIFSMTPLEKVSESSLSSSKSASKSSSKRVPSCSAGSRSSSSMVAVVSSAMLCSPLTVSLSCDAPPYASARRG